MRLSILALLMVAVGRFAYLTQEPARKGLRMALKFQLAPNAARANAILEHWRTTRPDDWQKLVLTSLYWDNWLICAYVPFLSLLGYALADLLNAKHPGVANWGHWLTGAALLAGMFDLLENACLRRTIRAGVAIDPWPQMGSSAAWAKWILLASIVLAWIRSGLGALE